MQAQVLRACFLVRGLVCAAAQNTCCSAFSLPARLAGSEGRLCEQPSRNKVSNRTELKDVSYDSQTPFSNILSENKWALASVIESSEEIGSKMTARKKI